MSRVKSPGCQSGREPHCQRTWFWASSNRSQLTAIGGWPQQTGRGGAETTNEAREQGMGILETKPSERMGTENQDKNRLGSLKSHVPRSWDLPECSPPGWLRTRYLSALRKGKFLSTRICQALLLPWGLQAGRNKSRAQPYQRSLPPSQPGTTQTLITGFQQLPFMAR